jgi:hypothetical protein
MSAWSSLFDSAIQLGPRLQRSGFAENLDEMAQMAYNRDAFKCPL